MEVRRPLLMIKYQAMSLHFWMEPQLKHVGNTVILFLIFYPRYALVLIKIVISFGVMHLAIWDYRVRRTHGRLL